MKDHKETRKLLKYCLTDSSRRHIKPGGWIEIQEMHHYPHCNDDSIPPAYALRTWLENIRLGIGKLGIDLSVATRNFSNLRNAGFINVQERVFKVPIGTWPKNKTLQMIGLYLRTVISDGLQAISLGPLVRGLGWSPEKVELLLVEVRKSLGDGTVHSYFQYHVVWAQKPKVGEGDEGDGR